MQTFAVNSLNQLSNVTRSGTLTVAGTTTGDPTSVTVNGSAATLYDDGMFAETGFALADGENTFTAIAQDAVGRRDTNSITVNLPAIVKFVYDLNGNLLSDGQRVFEYDDENQLIQVASSKGRTEFAYDGRMRRRIAMDYELDGVSVPLVTAATVGTLRNNFSGWVGFRFTVGAEPLVVTELGRWVVSGNSGIHTVKIVRADGTEIPGAYASVSTSGATAGAFAYADVASPVTLAPNTSYYLVSQEVSGGDQWYNYDTTLTSSGVATVDNSVYVYNGSSTYVNTGSSGKSYVPVSFRHQSWIPSGETRYIYDGMLAIQHRDGQNLPKITLTRGPDLSGTLDGAGGIGGLLARTENSDLLLGTDDPHAYFHADGGGNVTMLINSDEKPVAEYRFDPYGNTLSQTGPLAEKNTYWFSSKEWHAPSGLYYYGYRYYDPNLQRWLNADPLGELGGFNLHAFVGNNPISNLDSFGESWRDTIANLIVAFLLWWNPLHNDGDVKPQPKPGPNPGGPRGVPNGGGASAGGFWWPQIIRFIIRAPILILDPNVVNRQRPIVEA